MQPGTTDEQKLRKLLERILLDIKFMTEQGVLPKSVLDDYIYQTALDFMTPEFMKEFNNEKMDS
jgi:hypothetical protein